MTVDVPVTPHPDIARLEDEFRQFRVRVRDLALRGYRDGEWSLEDMNDSLRRLDLEPHAPRRSTRSTITIDLTLTRAGNDINATADELREFVRGPARDAARQALADVVARYLSDGFRVELHGHDMHVGFTNIVEDD